MAEKQLFGFSEQLKRLEHASTAAPPKRHHYEPHIKSMNQPQPNAEIELLSTPITVQNFYLNIHCSHAGAHGDEAERFTPNAQSAGSEAKIMQAEARLNLRLPPALSALYLQQNGGGLDEMCIPKPECTQHILYDHIITPFSGYRDLNPLEILNTLHETICTYADPEIEAERFPAGCERMIVLA